MTLSNQPLQCIRELKVNIYHAFFIHGRSPQLSTWLLELFKKPGIHLAFLSDIDHQAPGSFHAMTSLGP